jgi:hypothetical protein
MMTRPKPPTPLLLLPYRSTLAPALEHKDVTSG